MSRLRYIILVILVLLVLGVSFSGYRLYNYVENDPNFCGSCHIMKRAWITWQVGAHKNINCHVCHQQNIQDRIRIAWRWGTSNFEKVSPHTRLVRKVCEECHLNEQVQWPQVVKTVGHKVHILRADLQCLSCHLPSLHAFKPKAEDCIKCHDQARVNIGGMSGFHCTTCHEFLADKIEGLKPKRMACLNCHSGMQLKGETFPAEAPMKFDCAACHKPHSKPILSFSDCLGCHPEIAEDKRHFKSKALTQCVTCHRPHGWKAKKGLLPKQT